MSAENYHRIANALFTHQPKEWERYVRHVVPKMIPASELNEMHDDNMPPRICSRAKVGVLKLTSAHLNYITPRGQNWFAFAEWTEISDDEKHWLQEAVQSMQKELEGSNFYTAMISTVLDRICAGSCLMLCEEDHEQGRLTFTHIPVGTFAWAENKDHEVDTLVRKFKMTPHQAAQEFGYDSLSANIKASYSDVSTRYSEHKEIWHLVVPRDIPDNGNRQLRPEEMRWASVYLDPSEPNFIMRESGYYEWPFLTSRFLKTGNDPYGESALEPIVDTIEDNLLTMEALKVVTQVAAFPRLLVSGAMADEIDLRAGSITLLRPEDFNSNLPREFATAGNVNHAHHLLEVQHQEIDDALFVSVLQAVTQVDQRMTAFEANLRDNERLMTFTQTFTQFTCDLGRMLQRVFCCLERLGKLPIDGKPDHLFVSIDEFGVKQKILSPDIKYISRMAKALERNKLTGLVDVLGQAVSMAQATQSPAWMDIFNEEAAIRFIATESNVPAECLRSPQEVREIQAQRQAAEQAAQMMQLEQMQAVANRDNANAVQSLKS